MIMIDLSVTYDALTDYISSKAVTYIKSIYTADLPLFQDSFPASLYHPISSLLSIRRELAIPTWDEGVLWVQAKYRAQSPPLGQHVKYPYSFTPSNYLLA